MGVVYGAANLWQWKLHANEPGRTEYFMALAGSSHEALDDSGSTYVGLVGRSLDGLPTADLQPDWLARHYRFVDPRTGETIGVGDRFEGQPIGESGTGARLVIFHDDPGDGVAT
jgi:hypothetical protein